MIDYPPHAKTCSHEGQEGSPSLSPGGRRGFFAWASRMQQRTCDIAHLLPQHLGVYPGRLHGVEFCDRFLKLWTLYSRNQTRPSTSSAGSWPNACDGAIHTEPPHCCRACAECTTPHVPSGPYITGHGWKILCTYAIFSSHADELHSSGIRFPNSLISAKNDIWAPRGTAKHPSLYYQHRTRSRRSGAGSGSR